MEKVKKVDYLREWKNEQYNTTSYYFSVEFESGKKGEFSTNKREQIKFIVGNEYPYIIEITKKRKDNGMPYQFFDIDREAAKKANPTASTSTFKPYWDNKEYQEPRTREWALRESIRLLTDADQTSVKIDYVTMLRDKLYTWCYSCNPTPKQTMTRREALTLAIDSIAIKVFNIVGSDAVIAKAEEYYKYLIAAPEHKETIV